jgi:hypothetical protein
MTFTIKAQLLRETDEGRQARLQREEEEQQERMRQEKERAEAQSEEEDEKKAETSAPVAANKDEL